jgi:hypothetical protein
LEVAVAENGGNHYELLGKYLKPAVDLDGKCIPKEYHEAITRAVIEVMTEIAEQDLGIDDFDPETHLNLSSSCADGIYSMHAVLNYEGK